MIDYSDFFKEIEHTKLSDLFDSLPAKIESALKPSNNSDMLKWQQVLKKLPLLEASNIRLDSPTVEVSNPGQDFREELEELLLQLSPWRKGPFKIHGVNIDTEWRSDWKWQRLEKHVSSLKGRTVLDVGCGSGYHCFRMAGSGAKMAVGIEPSLLYVMQFFAIKHFTGACSAWVLPLTLEQFETNLRVFDTVFSMGVLYHRKSPFDHLNALKSCLRERGELVLETLVVDGKKDEVLVPEGRYAQMRNVWFLPSCLTLESWLKRCGFKNIRLMDITKTTIAEQRKTDWMTFDSLIDFLDPNDPDCTVEGYPAPVRAIFIAQN